MKKLPHIIIYAIPFAAILFILQSVAPSYSDKNIQHAEKKTHEDVYRRRESRDILSFADILKIVRPFIKGEIIETEFENEHGRLVYEIKYIDKAGRVMEIYVDARTGKLLKHEADD